jgi:hypothetical protein
MSEEKKMARNIGKENMVKRLAEINKEEEKKRKRKRKENG